MKISSLTEKGLDILYPPSLYCSCCGNVIDRTRTYNLCDHCISHIKWDAGEIVEKDGLKMLRCTEYGIYERTLIFSLKYNGKKYIARDLAAIVRDRLELEELDFDIIVPVPMEAGKEKDRGFNQAALIGKYLAKYSGKEQIADALIRNRRTMPMRGLGPFEREMNVRGAFDVTPAREDRLKGKRILLLDDFYTTGSTARECARVLTQAGIEDIWFIAFAAKY